MTSEGDKDMAAEASEGKGEGARRKLEYRKGVWAGMWCGIKSALGVVSGGDSHRYSTLKSRRGRWWYVCF